MATPKKKSAAKPQANKTNAAKKSPPTKTSAAKKAAAKPPATKRGAAKAVSLGLSADARSRLLKPRSGADDLAESLAGIWEKERGLRVDGLTSSKLRRLVEKSRKSNAKETALADAQSRKMAPVRDARLLADDALWRGLLDLRAAIALRARKDPAIEERFSALLDALKGAAPEDGGAPTTGT